MKPSKDTLTMVKARNLLIRALILTAFSLLYVIGIAKAQTLPYYNADGFHTSLRLVNPSAQPVVVDSVYSVGFGAMTVGPHSTVVVTDWPGKGGGVARLAVLLPASVEVSYGASSIRIPAQSTSAAQLQVQDLEAGAYVFAAVDSYAVLTFYGDDSFSSAVTLSPGVSISAVPVGANRAVVSPANVGFSGSEAYSVSSFFAFHFREGILQLPVPPTEVR